MVKRYTRAGRCGFAARAAGFLFMGGLAAFGPTGEVLAQQQCRVEQVGQATLNQRAGVFELPVRVNGSDMPFILDTGAEVSLVDVQLAQAMSLPPTDNGSAKVVVGADGKPGRIYPDVKVQSLEIAGMALKNVVLSTADRMENGKRSTTGILGQDFLRHFDVELDFPSQRLTLFNVQDCAAGFAPWKLPHEVVPLRFSQRGVPRVAVQFDGKPLELSVDTGASHTRIKFAAAQGVGVSEEALTAGGPVSKSMTVSGSFIYNYLHRFSSVRFGDSELSNYPVRVSQIPLPGRDGMVGLDLLRSRKVWISNATQQMFMAGGAAGTAVAFNAGQ